MNLTDYVLTTAGWHKISALQNKKRSKTKVFESKLAWRPPAVRAARRTVRIEIEVPQMMVFGKKILSLYLMNRRFGRIGDLWGDIMN